MYIYFMIFIHPKLSLPFVVSATVFDADIVISWVLPSAVPNAVLPLVILSPVVLGSAVLPPDVLNCDSLLSGILDPKELPAIVVRVSIVVSKTIVESDEDSLVVFPSNVVTIETLAPVLP